MIRRVIIDAFTASEFGHNGEAETVKRLHECCEGLVSLVATDSEDVVGHVLFSPVTIETRRGIVHGMGLAPLAVSPKRQKSGIGTALVESGLKQLSAEGCPFVVVLGHPDYYGRFGFRPAENCGITHGFAGIPQEVFQIKVLEHPAADFTLEGTVRYRPEFGPQE